MAETEIQFKVSAFLAALLAGGQSRQICPPDPQTVDGVKLRVQQIEFTSNTIRHEGERTQVAQEIVVHIASEEDVLAHLDGPPATVVRVPTCALIAVEYRPKGRKCEIGFDFDGIEPRPLPTLPPGLDPHKVEDLIERKIEEAFPPIKESIDFSAFLSKNAQIVTTGVSVSADERLIAFRAELGPVSGGSAQAWKGFFDGHFADRLGGEDWGVFLPREMLVETFVRSIRNFAESVKSKLFTIGEVSGRFTPAGNSAHIEVNLEVRLHPPDPLETIVLDTSVGIDLGSGEPGFLTTDVFLPNVEAILDGIHGAIGVALEAILGPAASGFQAVVDAALSDVNLPDDSGGLKECWQITPLHRRCRARLPNSTLGQTALRLNSFSAKPAGVLLGGRLRIEPLTPSTLETSVRQWRWKLAETSCPSPGSSSGQQDPAVMARAEVSLDHSGTTPAYICDATVLGDVLGKFPRNRVSWDDSRLPATIDFEVPDPGRDYEDNPYPIRLLVKTTLGARVFELGKLGKLDAAAQTQLTIETVEKTNRCKIILQIPGFNLKWLFDPPFIDLVVHHHWEILVSGLQLGDTLKLFDSVGKQLVHANVLPGFATWLSAMVAPGGEGELRFMRLRDGDAAPAVAGMGMEIRQQQLLRAAALPFASSCKRVFASAMWSEHGAVAVLDGHLAAFDFADPRLPRRLGGWQLDGLQDAFEQDGGLLAFSATGFYRVNEEGDLHPVGPDDEAAPIIAAAAGPGVVYVLTENSLEVRSPQLETISSQPFEHGRCLLRRDGHLIVGGQFGLNVFPLNKDGEIAEDSEYSWPDFTVTSLEAAQPASNRHALAHLANGTARLFAIGESNQAQELAEFTGRPWFAGGARLERALVLLSTDSRSLQVTIPGQSHLVGAEAATVSARS